MAEKFDDSILDECVGMLIGCAAGDCIGIPFETMTYEQIGNISEKDSAPYLHALDYWDSFYANQMGPNDKFEAGTHTDDTQLSSSLCRAFAKLDPDTATFSDMMDSIVKEHVRELDKPPCNINENHMTWGGTVNSIKRLQHGQSYRKSGNTATVGNGVLMKSIPLGYFYANASPKIMKKFDFSEKVRLEQVAIYSDMTHNTPQHRVSSNIFLDFLTTIFSNPKILDSAKTKKELLTRLVKKARQLEDEVFKQDCDQTKMKELSESDNKKERKWKMKHNCKFTRLSSLLEVLLSKIDGKEEKFHGLDDLTLIKVSNGGIYFNVYSLTMVIGLCLSVTKGKEGFDLELIKRSAFIGGDTDTNAAMIGAISGALNGMKILPKEYLENLKFFEELKKDALEFGKFMISVKQ